MLDIETAGTGTDAVLLTFGAIKFDPYSDDEPGPGIYFRINVDEQTVLGRNIDQGTMDWWLTQPAETREEAFAEDNRISILDFTKEVNRFVVGVKDIWAQGPVFDIPIIESLYRQLGIPAPWQYWQISDSRTLFKLKPDLRIRDKGAHNALVDAYTQAKSVQAIYKHFNITKQVYEPTS